MNELNILTSSPVGQISHENGEVSCAGQQHKEQGLVVDDNIVLEEVRLLIKPEQFIRHNSEVQAGSDHLLLPCTYQEGGCVTGEGTFAWGVDNSDCDLALVKSGEAEFTPDLMLISEAMKYIAQLRNPQFHRGCEIKDLFETSHKGLFASRRSDAKNAAGVRPQDFEAGLQAETAAEYGLFELAQKQANKEVGTLEPVCHRAQHQQQGRIVSLGAGRFAINAGQAIHTFRCQRRQVTLAEASQCFEDIPLAEPAATFLDPDSGIIKSHSAPRQCSSKFPVLLETNRGWVRITPEIHPAQAPLSRWPEEETTPEFIDLDGAGAFTEREQREWEGMLNFPHFHVATLGELTMQTCPGDRRCPAAIRFRFILMYFRFRWDYTDF